MTRLPLLDRLIRFSLEHRVLVLASAALLLVLGAFWVFTVPVDIFPDLSAPSVTVVTEAPGMAPEEVEALVTFPIESAVNGATGIRRLRSVSADGLSVLWVEFEWGTEIYRARQVVTERLQRVELPEHVERPELGPISSIMGEITFIALTSEQVPPMDLRRIAETMVRRNLLAIPGVSQVVPIGGEVRELQITVRPEALAQHGVALDEVLTAAALSSRSPAAGFHVEGGQEYLVRGLGRARQPEEVAAAVVRTHDGAPIRIGDLANVAWGPEPQRGTASYRAQPAVILSVQKQPGANTLRSHPADRSGSGAPGGRASGGRHHRERKFPPGRLHLDRDPQRHGGAARRRDPRGRHPVPVPRKLAHDAHLGPGHSAVADRRRAGGVARRRHHQHHDPRRAHHRDRRAGRRRHHRRRERVSPPAARERQTRGPAPLVARGGLGRLVRGAQGDRVRHSHHRAGVPAASRPPRDRGPPAAPARDRVRRGDRCVAPGVVDPYPGALLPAAAASRGAPRA